MQPSGLLSVHEAAIRLGAAEETVISWAMNNTLPARLIDGTYWFQPADVAAFANAVPDGNPPGEGEVSNLLYPPNDPPTPR
jgi:hypothetical protein